MARAYLDITPDMLTHLPSLLPRGANIFGSMDAGGVVKLILEGNDLPDGKQLDMIITEGPMSRLIELKEADVG